MKYLPAAALLALAACVQPQATEVPQRRALATEATPSTASMAHFAAQPVARVTRSNASIAADILELAFQMESGRDIRFLTRFEGPVTVAMAGSVPATASRDLAALLGRLRSEARLDIRQTASPASASIVVEFVPRSTMQAAVPHAACFVVPNVGTWSEFRAARGTTKVDWTQLTTRTKATVFIPSDVAPQEVRDCLHEELAQALGPLNDLYHLSDSVFNDDNFNTVLTGFDMTVLRAFYAPELRSGMTRSEVAARLPGVLARINPAGGKGAPLAPRNTPRAWINAIEAALTPRASESSRRAHAQRALAIAQSQGWTDNRRAFAHFIAARMSLSSEIEYALENFTAARKLYANLPNGALHVAHVDMQMAAFALSSGQFAEVLTLTDRATPAITREQNAAVLATLKMLRAEALAASGRLTEAKAARLDSQTWARYGFGSDARVQARLADIAALTPRRSAARY